MVKFIIIRHGYSVGNKEKRFSGQMDTPLDEVGIWQAKYVAKYVSENFEVDAIYSSDLSRAYETVKPLADEIGMAVTTDKDLREVDVGLWQGMLIEDIENTFPEEFDFFRSNPGCFKFPDGESYQDVMKRASRAFAKIAQENDGKTVVVGTHGGVIRNLRAVWDKVQPEKIKEIPHVSNASISIAEYDKGEIQWLQIGYNDFLVEKITEAGISQ